MSELHDAPNQQVVRPDGSTPWEEGEGGSEHEPAESPADAATDDYDLMSKADLLELAQERGLSPANNDMTKAQLIEGLRAAD